VLGCARTSHRAHGANPSGTTILHVRRVFTPAIVYVMLSRSNLYVFGKLTPADSLSVHEAAFGADGAAARPTRA
jgi:hypothetical protein